MDLSSVNPNSEDFLKTKRGRRNLSSSYSCMSDGEIETIDINSIHFEDDESWLCSSNSDNPVLDLDKWLHKDLDINYTPLTNITSHIDSQKNVDTRTFTRPKKRFTRPSIERYNEDMYGSSSETITLQTNSRSFIIEENLEPATVTDIPVNFDLSLPSSSYYFEKIVADSGEIDSFQNMSPPSLVNSMCSSTFANLMDSSFIKNDPVLREIRDTDYSETVLLQDFEAPMFQSITESCSSINSDTPENFLKKVSFNGTFKRNVTKDGDRQKFTDTTFNKPVGLENEEESTIKKISDSTAIRNDENWVNPNGTYRRTPKHNGTFKRSDIKKSQIVLNTTFEAEPQQKINTNTTHVLIKDYNGIEDMKKELSDPIDMHTDLNRITYCLENNHIQLDEAYDELNRSSNNLKTSTLSGSVGSADSLDRLSSMSSSSRGSNKMLNMADVDAIVEMQERSLQQVMSTPITSTAAKRLTMNHFISPITRSEAISDSDHSSNDDYKSVRSTISSKGSLDQYAMKQQPKSLDYVTAPLDTKLKINQKPSYNTTAPKPMPVVRPNAKTNSYSNLKLMHSNIPGSYSNIYKTSTAKPANTGTNLKTMSTKLKGSYTSLRPMSSILPVAPPLISSSTTTTLNRDSVPLNIVEVQPMPREKITLVGDSTFVKPHPVKASGLPRPTGIPRPASKIPAPRSSNVRPKTSRSAYSKSEMKTLNQ